MFSNYFINTHHSEGIPFTRNCSCEPFTAGHQQHQWKRKEEKTCQLTRFHSYNLTLLSFMAESLVRKVHTNMACNEAGCLYILNRYPRNSVFEDKFVISDHPCSFELWSGLCRWMWENSNEKKSISSSYFHQDNVKTFKINRSLKLQLPFTQNDCHSFSLRSI